LNSERGMRLPGNGWPLRQFTSRLLVEGSRNAEKSPARSAGVGTVAVLVNAVAISEAFVVSEACCGV
jgi:hypothetical protein